jgi:hypothetical protein
VPSRHHVTPHAAESGVIPTITIDPDETSNSSDDDVFETPAQTPARTPDPDPQQAAISPQSPAAQQIAEDFCCYGGKRESK